MTNCKICKTKLIGRKGKLFCSIECKNFYHSNLRRVTNTYAITIDRILHRNRSILLEVMGKYQTQKKIKRIVLAKKEFQFKYLTHYYINSKGKIYHQVYDFAWVEFSDDEILIVRRA